MKKVLITGASGMLGRALSRTIKGYEVAGLGRRDAKDLPIPYRRCDVTDPEATKRTVRSISPDVVIHAAAFTDVDGCESQRDRAFQVNVGGAHNVLEALKGMGALFVFISTDYVFDGEKGTAYSEEDATRPLSVYAETKCRAEDYIREKAERYLIVRTSWLFGPHGKNFVDTIIMLADRQTSLRVVDDQRGRPTYTVDLAQSFNGILAWCGGRAKTGGEILHVANRGETTWCEFAQEIVALTGKRVVIQPVASRELGRPAARPCNSVLSTDKFYRITAQPLRPWKTALHDYIVSKERQEISG